MTAQDILLAQQPEATAPATPQVAPEAPLPLVLAQLLDSPTGTVSVTDGTDSLGQISMRQALTACSALMPVCQECSQITLTLTPEEYSASALSRAVEDADAQLLDLYTIPTADGLLQVVLRTSRIDPTPVSHSLERYGFTVSSTEGSTNLDHDTALERIEALRRYLDI